MSLTAGTRLGPYVIEALLGVGGMGQVYRARDSRLNRDVAIKVLPEGYAQDADRLARFTREAQALAALNHPNIAQIYGIEEAPSTGSGQAPSTGSGPGAGHAIVMELVEGPTLADRLAGGAILPDEALPIARQVAQALEAAHERGIIHRDLKPANIKVRPDGTVKVLDFGLAKALTATESDESASPTITSPALMTAAGVLLGTAAYMSPEQARGRPVDKRTDIWAFGAVLYEMLTGRRAFQGDDVTDAVASVVAREPDWTQLPAGLGAIRICIMRCLQKDPRQRMRDIGDVRLALEGAFEATPAEAAQPTASATPARRRVLPVVASAAAAAIATALIAWRLWPAATVPSMTRFDYVLPEGHQLGTAMRPVIAVSPDGRFFVYQSSDGLYLRPMDALEARLITGTTPGADSRAMGVPGFFYNAFVSRDGRSIGFFAANQLKKIAVEGGTPVVLCQAATPYGASWGEDNTIVFGQPSGIMRVSGDGGTPELVVKAADGEEIYGPQLLPGGDKLLFSVTTDRSPARWSHAQIVVQSLSSGKRTVVIQAGSDARYLPTGHIVYALEDAVLGVAFDVEQLATRGGAVPVLQGVRSAFGVAAVGSNYSVSDRGTLVYLTETRAPRSFVWVDRKGLVEPIGTIPPGSYDDPRLSREGRQLLSTHDDDLWVYELPSGRGHRLTQDRSSMMGVWDPTGSQVAYSSAKSGNLEAWVVPSDGSGQARQLTRLGGQVHVDSWSPDGRLLAIHHHRGSAPTDVLVLPMDRPDAQPESFIKGEFSAEGADFSRDGRHAAYLSQESGQREIYVRPYPGPGRQQIVSVGGGREPAWSPNGEIFFRSLAGDRMFAAPASNSPDLRIGTPVTLFEGRYYVAPTGSPRRQYDVTPDGQRLIMLTPGNTASGPRAVVVENWFEELKRRVPTR
jgi:serine/threonine-protein kinase